MDVLCNSSSSSSSSSVLSLTSPSPKSPPPCPDLYGKRRQLAKVQVLEREISMLEEELKSLEGLQLASRCCKELDDFVEAKADPLMTIDQKTRRSKSFWKRMWRRLCCKFPCLCCFCGCSHLRMPNCCACCCCCCCCPSKKSSTPSGIRLEESSCQKCCRCPDLSCPGCTCSCGFKSCFAKCRKVKLCCNCGKTCCNPCC